MTVPVSMSKLGYYSFDICHSQSNNVHLLTIVAVNHVGSCTGSSFFATAAVAHLMVNLLEHKRLLHSYRITRYVASKEPCHVLSPFDYSLRMTCMELTRKSAKFIDLRQCLTYGLE